MNKKAELDETLTWIIALVIVFFIMLLFTLGSIGIAATKGSKGDSGEKISSDISPDLASTENLIALLELKTDIEGKSIKELIFVSMDSLISSNYRENFLDTYAGGNINMIYSIDSQNIRKILDDKEYADYLEKYSIAEKEINKILTERCEKYYFKTPNMFLKAEGQAFPTFYVPEFDIPEHPDVVFSDVLDNNDGLNQWSKIAVAYLPYKGYLLEIKYRVLKKCLN